MSHLTIKYPKNIQPYIAQQIEHIRKELIAATAQGLGAKPEGVIVEFTPWDEPKPPQAPDVLIRGETSIYRKDKLEQWSAQILSAWKALEEKQGIPTKDLRVAVKAYAVELTWNELSR